MYRLWLCNPDALENCTEVFNGCGRASSIDPVVAGRGNRDSQRPIMAKSRARKVIKDFGFDNHDLRREISEGYARVFGPTDRKMLNLWSEERH